jgi:hypothetical protein
METYFYFSMKCDTQLQNLRSVRSVRKNPLTCTDFSAEMEMPMDPVFRFLLSRIRLKSLHFAPSDRATVATATHRVL